MKLPAAFLIAVTAFAQHPMKLVHPVQDKNFYVLSLIENTPAARGDIAKNPVLDGIAVARRAALAKASANCALDLDCYAAAMKWSAADNTAIAGALRGLYKDSAAVRRLVEGPLRQSGAYIREQGRQGDDLLAGAFANAARGIDNAIDVYCAGKPPRYPDIDSVTYDVKSDSYRRLIQIIAATLDDDASGMELFFQPSLRFALAAMDANHRDEAGRFEPLETGENAAAIARIRATAWARFPYSVIVVPGSGTDRLSVAFSPYGKVRVALAAKRYREGKAPFILVSGGFVHPNQTPHCEAVEMKKSLMADFGIPESAILIDPHARHTTTNMRNAARQMDRYGIPLDRKALIVTDPLQSQYIESQVFKDRCIKELGYEPQQPGARLSRFDLEFLPKIDSLQIDPLDPLDP